MPQNMAKVYNFYSKEKPQTLDALLSAQKLYVVSLKTFPFVTVSPKSFLRTGFSKKACSFII